MFNLLLILINKKKFLDLQFAFGKFNFYNSNEPPRKIRRICHVEKNVVHGRNVFVLKPKIKKSKSHILYLHGGAYVQGFVRQHWDFLSILVQETGCTITAPDYPLAPRSTFVEAYSLIDTLYTKILSTAGAANTILMGDSAGGGLALGFAQKMKFEKRSTPGKIILLSPWLDITLVNPDIEIINSTDPFLSVKGLRRAGLSFAGGADPKQFQLSPVNGDIDGIGEISLFVGSRDILVADARRLRVLAKEAGISLNYYEYKDMVHVWMLLNFRESRQAKKEIFDLILN